MNRYLRLLKLLGHHPSYKKATESLEIRFVRLKCAAVITYFRRELFFQQKSQKTKTNK